MNKEDENQLLLEVEHIFNSGANPKRIIEMVTNFIDKRFCHDKSNMKELIKYLRDTYDFVDLGSGWVKNDGDNIKIRFWKNDEVDFWDYTLKNERDAEILFRGKIYTTDDIDWVLKRCFGYE